MTFTDPELAYLRSQRLGRLATVLPDGTPQVCPVGFHLNAELGTIDIYGFTMSTSQKYHNVARTGRASIVVDDIASHDPWRVRLVEIRGDAQAVPAPEAAAGGPAGVDGAIIRIHPRRVISFGLDQVDVAPHLATATRRTIA